MTFLNEKKRKESCSILKVKKRKEMRGEKVEKEKGERERKLSTTPWLVWEAADTAVPELQ